MCDKQALGELRIALNALYRRLADMEQRLRRLENPQAMTGSVEGLQGEWTMTPVPLFEEAV